MEGAVRRGGAVTCLLHDRTGARLCVSVPEACLWRDGAGRRVPAPQGARGSANAIGGDMPRPRGGPCGILPFPHRAGMPVSVRRQRACPGALSAGSAAKGCPPRGCGGHRLPCVSGASGQGRRFRPPVSSRLPPWRRFPSPLPDRYGSPRRGRACRPRDRCRRKHPSSSRSWPRYRRPSHPPRH